MTVVFCLNVTLSPVVTTFRNSMSSVVGRYKPTNGVNSTLPCPARRIGAAARTNAATQPAGPAHRHLLLGNGKATGLHANDAVWNRGAIGRKCGRRGGKCGSPYRLSCS